MNIDRVDFRQDLRFEAKYIKLKSELSATREVNNKLKVHIVSLERHC